MKTAQLMIAVAGIAVGGSVLFGSAAFAEGPGTNGTITGINRLTGTVGIATTTSGTVGANAPVSAPSEQYKVKDGALLDSVHAGDRVTFSASDSNGEKTITKLDREK